VQAVSRFIAIALTLLVSGCVPHEISPSLEGRVVNRDTLMPIKQATVKYTSFPGNKIRHATTDENGVFALNGYTLWSPPYVCCSMRKTSLIQVTAPGYLDWEVTLYLDEPVAQPLAVGLIPK
jgi:hypothetical protein